ncbi:MAG: hypothetical protein ABI220_01440 [Candidatus Saccharimonadales bacterium]
MKITNLALRSLVLGSTPISEMEQRQELKRIPNSIKRTAALSIHLSVNHHPRLTASTLGVDLTVLRKLHLIGAGGDSIVFMDGDSNVLKLHHRTVFHSESTKQTDAKTRQEKFETLASYLGTFVVTQTSFIANHPFIPKLSVVQTRQPYIRSNQDVDIFSRYSEQVDTGALETLLEKNQSAADQLAQFVDNSVELYEHQRMVPDTRGKGNLVVNEHGEIILVDATPTTRDNISGQMCTLRQLEHLGSILQEI